MDHDFLDGIDEHFERLMKLHGNGQANGSSRGRSDRRSRNGVSRDRTCLEILERLEGLSSTQKRQVLDFVESLNGNSDQLDFSQSPESDVEQS